MSLIVNSPITLPVVAKDVPTPISGTRGLVAKYDGWYDYQSDGTETKIPSPNDNLKFVNGKGIVFGVPDNYDPESVYKNRINNNGIEMAIAGGETHIEVGKVEIVCGDETHNLSEKANTADVFLKSSDVVLADGKKISADVIEGDMLSLTGNITTGITGGDEGNITTLNGDIKTSCGDVIATEMLSADGSIPETIHKLSKKANTADVILKSDKTIELLVSDAQISLGEDSSYNTIITSGEVTVTNSDSNGYQHKLTEKLSQSQLELYLENSDEKQFYGGISVTRNDDDADVKVIIPGNPNTGVETTVHKLSEKVDKSYVDGLVMESGGGDMLRTVYDKDKTGTVDDSKKLGGQLPSYYAKAADLAEKWTGKVYTVEVGTDWEIHTVTSNGEEKLGSYYQEIAVEGITAVGQPFVDVVLPDDDVQAKQQLTDYQCVSRVKTENGKIILKCFEDRPSSSFTIRVLVLGNTL